MALSRPQRKPRLRAVAMAAAARPPRHAPAASPPPQPTAIVRHRHPAHRNVRAAEQTPPQCRRPVNSPGQTTGPKPDHRRHLSKIQVATHNAIAEIAVTGATAEIEATVAATSMTAATDAAIGADEAADRGAIISRVAVVAEAVVPPKAKAEANRSRHR